MSSPPHVMVMLRALLRISRPFTLLPPALGMLSGAVAALAVERLRTGQALEGLLLQHGSMVALGAIMAMLLNAASNVLNQATEVELDRINKPHRVLPQGALSVGLAVAFSVLLYVAALLLAWQLQPAPGVRHAFWCALTAALATVLYTVRPVYLKARGWWANLTIAVPRGMLLKVAGWATVRAADHPEPWFMGAVFALFILGAASSKDFADVVGDRAHGIGTLPVRYGPAIAARRIAPAFVLPWLMLPLGVWTTGPGGQPWLQSAPIPTTVLAVVLCGVGASMLPLLRDPEAISREANHPIWARMYALMMLSQVGLAACYVWAVV